MACMFWIVILLYANPFARFRWAHCQLRELKSLRCLRPSYIEAILNNLPSTLDETYSRMLHQIEPQLRNDAIVLLRWMAYAKQPLTLTEISDTVLIDLTTEHGSVAIEDRGSVEDALDILPGLIMIIEDYNNGVALDDAMSNFSRAETYQSQVLGSVATKKVKLAHFSVKEYLESSRILESGIKSFYLSRSIAEQFLADSCNVYLMHYASSDLRIETDKDLMTFPLLKYAANYWHEHCQPEANSWKQFLFLQSPEKVECWRRIYDQQQPTHFGLSQNAGLMCASYFGLNSVIRELVTHGADIHIRSGKWLEYPLLMAASRGHEHTVRMLIEEYNADVMVEGRRRPTRYGLWTALDETISQDHEQVAIMLFERCKLGSHASNQYVRNILY